MLCREHASRPLSCPGYARESWLLLGDVLQPHMLLTGAAGPLTSLGGKQMCSLP